MQNNWNWCILDIEVQISNGPEEEEEEEAAMSKAKTICTVCNHIYDEALGEPLQDIPPSLRFEDLPDEWKCPECGSARDMFQPCSCVSLPIYEQTCVVRRRDGSSSSEADNPESTPSKTTPVGQLVAQRRSRTCVLEQYGIDYCCGGKATLEDACREKGLKVEEVLKKIIAADGKDVQSHDPLCEFPSPQGRTAGACEPFTALTEAT